MTNPPDLYAVLLVGVAVPPAFYALCYNVGEYWTTAKWIADHPGRSAGNHREIRHDQYGKSKLGRLFFALGAPGRELAYMARK
jgi:hypothetical protein